MGWSASGQLKKSKIWTFKEKHAFAHEILQTAIGIWTLFESGASYGDLI